MLYTSCILAVHTPPQRTLLDYLCGEARAWWLHVAFVAETPLLLLLLARAFPASELPQLPRDDDTDSDSPGAGGSGTRSEEEAARLV